MSKYIFVTGGVCSSLGKGVAASSLGSILENRGLSVRMMKIDPYLNLNAGLMDPLEHGEVYVTSDGAETDLDLGNYARFTRSPIAQRNSITTGQIYDTVIQKTRDGKFNGICVQVVPHITDEIKGRIYSIGNEEGVEITIVEVGGTVGDIESIPYLEAIRQIIHEVGPKNALSVHLALLPTVSCGEIKTKPAQHSVKSMREIGIQPQILICRCDIELQDEQKRKISLFTNIDERAVISGHNVEATIYEIPLSYHKQGLDSEILHRLEIDTQAPDLSAWEKVVDSYKNSTTTLNVAMVGKYAQLDDAYKSTDEAILHGALANGVRVRILKVDSNLISSPSDLDSILAGSDAIIAPSGFGASGVEGISLAVTYAREKKIPFLGVSLGMQIMALEYANSVAKIDGSNSIEFDPTAKVLIVDSLKGEIKPTQYGSGELRLGDTDTVVVPNTKLHQAYGKDYIAERHRHQFKLNNDYTATLEEAGLIFSATSTHNGDPVVEAIEWSNHPWGVGVQFHPEYTSQPVNVNPVFESFMKAALDYRSSK